MKKLVLASLFALSAPAFATTPASGTLTEASGPQTFTGGPYVLPTPGGIVAGSGVECEVPMTCDEYSLTVTIADKFRMDDKNKKEVVQITMTPSGPASANADIDLYLLDASGAEVSSSTGGTAAEAIAVPLSILKDGAYTVRLITGIPLGSSEEVVIQIGRSKATKELVITPAVASPGETVRFDARSLGGTLHQFDFGDGETTQSSDGIAEHVYTQPGNYRARVTYSGSGAKAQSAVMQTVVVSEAVATASDTVSGLPGKGGALTLGAFGTPVLLALFALFGLALVRRRA